MSVSPPPAASLEAPSFQFDDRARTVRVGSRTTALDPRAATILRCLIDRMGERVSKDELLAVGWPGRLVHENSLAKTISRLRAALAGSSLEIQAAYGVGYVLQPTAAADGPPADDALHDPPPTVDQSRPTAARRWKMAVAAAILLAAALAAAWLRFQGPHAVPLRTAPPLTSDAPGSHATLLWVDDHPENNRLETEFFRRSKLAVHLATNTDAALKLLAINQYDLVISDLGRGEDRLAGLDLIARMRQRSMETPVMIYTMRANTPQAQAEKERMIREAGAADLAVTPQEVRAKVIARF